MQRTIGRILISAAAIQTAAVPVLAGSSAGHVAGDQRSGRARLRGAISLALNGILAPAALWMVWRGRPEPGVAAAITIAYWGTFLVMALTPASAVEDADDLIPRVVGVPGHITAGVWGVLAAGLRWYLTRR